MAEVIRQRAQVFNKPVGVIRTQGGAQQLGQTISSVASGLTQQAYRVAAEDAQKRGIDVAQSVEEKNLLTFDPETGKPEVFSPPPAFGRIASNAYQEIIDKRFIDSMNSELQLKAKEISLKYQYNPDAYDDVFSDYIGAMSENATGKYKQFIESTGADYLARTKLNIQQRVQVRARENLAQAASNSAKQGAEDAYEQSRIGNFNPNEGEEISATQKILETEVGNVSRAVATNLLKVGADEATRDSIALGTAMGGVEFLLSKTNTSAERNALELAIRTRGREVSGVPKELRAQLDNLLPYVDGGNINKVLTHASGVSADYNAVENDQIALSKAEAERFYRQQVIQSDRNNVSASIVSSSAASNSFKSDDINQIGAGFQVASTSFQSIVEVTNSRFISGGLTESERESELVDARQSTIRPFLIEAAAEGNVAELAVAIQTRNPSDMENLSPKQKAFISALHSSPAFNAIDDMAFVRSELSASDNSIRTKRDNQRAQFELSQDVTALGEAAAVGGISEDQYTAMQGRIKDAVGVSMTPEQAKSELNRLNRQRAFGEISLFSAGATSLELTNLSTYIDSDGQRTEGMPQDVIDAGNKILGMTSPNDVDALTGKIGGLKVTIASQEAEAQKIITKQENVARILGGGGSPNSTQDQKLAQEILDSSGIDLAQFDSMPEEMQSKVYSWLRTVPPTGLLDKLNDIGTGVQVANSEAYLNLFARLSTDVSANGVMINRFGKSLSDETVEFLTDVNQNRITIGGSASEIAQTLLARRNDPKSRIAMDAALGEKTPTEYILEYTDGTFSSPDPFLAAELASSVEYLALTGKSQSQINNRLNVIINQKYPETEFIADPRFPVGSIKRSRYALEATFPDDGERTAFTQAVESQLPAGFSLYGDQSNQQAAMAAGYSQFAMSEEDVAAGKQDGEIAQVYLVPDESTAGVTYFAYFVDKNSELQPLIYEVDGVRTFPAFDKDETADYRTQAAIDKAAAMREDLDVEESRIEAYRKRPGIRSMNDVKNLRFGN